MNEPRIELPEHPSKTQILHAAMCAGNYSDRLLVEATKWREISHELYDQVDDICEKQKRFHNHTSESNVWVTR